MAILVNGEILTLGGVASGRVYACSLRGTLVSSQNTVFPAKSHHFQPLSSISSPNTVFPAKFHYFQPLSNGTIQAVSQGAVTQTRCLAHRPPMTIWLEPMTICRRQDSQHIAAQETQTNTKKHNPKRRNWDLCRHLKIKTWAGTLGYSSLQQTHIWNFYHFFFWNITLPWGKNILQKVLFLITHLIFSQIRKLNFDSC